MKISQSLSLLRNVGAENIRSLVDQALKDTNATFGETLNKAIADVDNLQNEAEKAVDKMVVGESVDLHDVMIAVEKAKTSSDILMEIRNETIAAYQEIMRMQRIGHG